ncbi:MAG: FAD-binding oxidoreductase [Pseudomonadota bacterium]
MTPLNIAVIGGGIVGISSAEWLRRDGHNVTLIDRNDPGTPAQTSYGNAGILAVSSYIPVPVPGLLKKVPGLLFGQDGPLYLKWGYLPRLMPWLLPFLRRANETDVMRTVEALGTITDDTVDQHKALAEGTPATAHIVPGIYAFLYPSRAACEADSWGHGLRQSRGVEIEFRDRARLLEDDPHLGTRYNYAACHHGHGWITDPGAYVAALFGHFRAEGGAFRQGEVDDIAGDGRVTIAGETETYDRVVLAGGAWSAKLAARLGHDPGLESERGYHILFAGASRRPPFPYMLADSKFVATPMERGVRCAGQVEFGGLEAGPSEAPYRLVHKRIKQLYPDMEWSGEERWLGHRPSTVDSVPFIGPSPKAPNIHFAFGAQHIGLTTGPRTGRLIADMIGGRTPNIDMTPFAVGRFDKGRGPARADATR